MMKVPEMRSPWRLFRNLESPVSTAEGLAVDDTLPCAVGVNHSPPILHLYTFIPSAIVGKYQDMEAALRLDRCKARGIEYNRRSTGGGTVIMGPEIVSLGLGINVDYPGLKKGVGGVFESLSRVLIHALTKLGIRCLFSTQERPGSRRKKNSGVIRRLRSQQHAPFSYQSSGELRCGIDDRHHEHAGHKIPGQGLQLFQSAHDHNTP